MPDPMQALQKASSISSALDERGVRKPARYLDTPAEEADPIRTFLRFVGKVGDLGLGQPEDMGIKTAGIGGLPEGLNAQALLEMLKREEEWGKIAPAVGSAVKQGATKIAPSIMRMLK